MNALWITPQTWDRYACVEGTPLMLADRLGLCATVNLNQGSDDSKEVGGPFEPEDETAAGAADGGDCWDGGYLNVDGVEVPDDIAEDFEALGGGPMGGGSPSAISFGCVDWMACAGKKFALNQNNQIVEYELQWTVTDTCAGPYCKGAVNPGVGWQIDADPTGAYRLVAAPGGGCGWDIVCDFYTGIAGAAVDGNPLELLRSVGASAAGAATLGAVGGAVAEYGPVLARTVADAPNVAYQLAFRAYTNPELIQAASDAVNGFAAASPFPPGTWAGVAGFTAYAIYSKWDSIESWFDH